MQIDRFELSAECGAASMMPWTNAGATFDNVDFAACLAHVEQRRDLDVTVQTRSRQRWDCLYIGHWRLPEENISFAFDDEQVILQPVRAIGQPQTSRQIVASGCHGRADCLPGRGYQ